ncbi:hypothetical protein [Bacillus cereus]|nr:hypothetical protein [Bacillus cereus]
MNYNKEEILALEAKLYQEVVEYQRKQTVNDATVKIENILAHLSKYG